MDLMYYVVSFVLPLLLLAMFNAKLMLAYRQFRKKRRILRPTNLNARLVSVRCASNKQAETMSDLGMGKRDSCSGGPPRPGSPEAPEQRFVKKVQGTVVLVVISIFKISKNDKFISQFRFSLKYRNLLH